MSPPLLSTPGGRHDTLSDVEPLDMQVTPSGLPVGAVWNVYIFKINYNKILILNLLRRYKIVTYLLFFYNSMNTIPI